MTDIDKLDELLEAHVARIREKFKPRRALEQHRLEGWRRKRIESQYQEKLQYQILESAGIDLAEIRKKYGRGSDSWLGYRDEQSMMVKDLALRSVECQRARIEQHATLADKFYMPGADIPYRWFRTADKIHVDEDTDKSGNVDVNMIPPQVQKGPGENWVKFYTYANAKDGGKYSQEYDFFFNFVWNKPSESGFASVTSWLQPSGCYLLGFDEFAFFYKHTSVKVYAEFYVEQPLDKWKDYGRKGATVVYDSVTGGFVMGLYFPYVLLGGDYTINDEIEITINQVDYQAEKPLFCTWAVHTGLWVDDGEAKIDFRTHPYWINVPGVCIKSENF
jgi:hypothetical protein